MFSSVLFTYNQWVSMAEIVNMRSLMKNAECMLREVLADLAPAQETIAAARSRRNDVLAAGKGFHGFLRSYSSGSIAHKTANDDTDADGGVVLDRRSYPELGLDGNGGGPSAIVEDMRAFIRERLQRKYPRVRFQVTKRAIKVFFNEPVASGTDPTVDLIVALTRKDGGLWIPNMLQGTWNASDPECHTRLLTEPPEDLRRKRAEVIRLVKGWNKQYSKPGLSGFNISALALKAVEGGVSLPDALLAFYRYAASDLSERLTPDPAGVSLGIKVLADTRGAVVQRLSNAKTLMLNALKDDADEDLVRENLAALFHKHLHAAPGLSSKAALAQALRSGNSLFGVSSGVALLSEKPEAAPLKNTRAHGDHGPLR